jgi:hypothetical protein
MRELLIKVIDMLNNQDWFIDKEKSLQMYDRFNITAHFAKQGDYTCFFFIDNMQFEHIVYKNPQLKTKRSN